METSIFEIEPHHPTDVGVGDLALALFEDGAFYRAGLLTSNPHCQLAFRSRLESPDALDVLSFASFTSHIIFFTEIIEVSEEDVKVSFLDYGNLVTLSRSKLRSPSKKLSQYPRLCFCVKVSNSYRKAVFRI